MQKTMVKQVNILGHSATICNHGLEALVALDASIKTPNAPADAPTYDLILLDLEMVSG
jgi:CheY-like chemotaxis protein